MDNLKKMAAIGLLGFAVLGCGNNNNNGGGGGGGGTGGTAGGGGGGGGGPPPKPALTGAQIDRMGRGTINVAVTDPFDAPMARDLVRDQYNADADPTMWAAHWVPKFKASLPVYDAVDTKCGNQLLAGATVDANRYATLATVLADDRIYLDVSQTAASIYFGVELHTVGAHIGTTNNDQTTGIAVPASQGGRTPMFDVVALMYSAAAIGSDAIKADGTFGFNDGVAADPDPNGVNVATFPFLGDPN